jgi:hypothetical protein
LCPSVFETAELVSVTFGIAKLVRKDNFSSSSKYDVDRNWFSGGV